MNIIWIYDGTITVVLPGSYTFCTASDDGSWLYVDNVVVVRPRPTLPAGEAHATTPPLAWVSRCCTHAG